MFWPNKGVSNDPKAVTSLLRSLASKKSESKRITSILLELRDAGVQLNVFHCSAAIKAFHCSASGWSKALDFVSKMNSWAVIPDDLVIAAALHSFDSPFLASGWAVAITFLPAKRVPFWQDERWAAVQVNPVMSVCSTCDQWRMASSVLYQTPALRATLDAISYNSLCDSFVRKGRWHGSITALFQMQEKTIQSDVISFNSAINTCATAWVKVLHLVQDIEKRNLQMSEKSCGASVKACVSKWRIAASLLEVVRGRALEMNAILGHSVVAACSTSNQWQHALKHASKMQGDGRFDCKALVASIHAVSKAKCWSLPLSLFRIHQRDCHDFDSIPSNAALAACGEGNSWATGLKLFETIALKALVPDEVTWASATSSFEQGARWKHALHFLGKAMHRSVETDICNNSAASSCEKASHWQQALALVSSGDDAGNVESIGFNAAITACQNVGAWQWSLQLVSELYRRQMATEVSYSEAAIAAAQASCWPLSLVLLGLCDGGAAWATSMGSAIEATGPVQRVQLLAQLGRSSVKFLSEVKFLEENMLERA